MSEKKVLIVSASSGDIKDSLLFKNCASLPKEVEMVGNSYNDKSLASIYNKYINENYKDYVVVFVHDDVFLSDHDFIRRCNAAIKQYDVFGVAGGVGGLEITPEKPALWHLICKSKVGYAGHYADMETDNGDPYSECWVTSFGKTPQKATLIDGVFFGVNVESALKVGVTFDEECPAKFHFYDLLFCIRSKMAGLNIGVFPFNIFHKSHGLREYTEEFMVGDQYFKEYCSKLV